VTETRFLALDTAHKEAGVVLDYAPELADAVLAGDPRLCGPM
jgi:hypothetical protein